MKPSKAILCPSCHKLISNYISHCPHCGVAYPGSSVVHLLFKLRNVNLVNSIIALNVVMFLLSLFISLIFVEKSPLGRLLLVIPSPSSLGLHIMGWAYPKLIFAGQWWMLITAIFLHGNLLHLFFNMMWVKDLAPLTSHCFSKQKMFIIYILSGIAGNLASVIFLPNPVIGASGAVFGLMGAMIVYGKKSKEIWGQEIAKKIWFLALIMLVFGFTMSGISNAAHIGGFVAGTVLSYFILGKPQNHKLFISVYYLLFALCLLAFFYMFYYAFQIITQI